MVGNTVRHHNVRGEEQSIRATTQQDGVGRAMGVELTYDPSPVNLIFLSILCVF